MMETDKTFLFWEGGTHPGPMPVPEKGGKIMLSIFFSPRGTTKTTARAILRPFEGVRERDLLGSPLAEDLEVPAEEPVLVVLPVYAGRIPQLCREQLAAHLKGHGGPAAAVAVYGNRHYDSALVELQDLLEGNGFRVVAAGAFIACHSIFDHVAAGRPDQADLAAMEDFGVRYRARLAAFVPGGDHAPLALPGSRDLPPHKRLPFHPAAGDRCSKCGACAAACPAGAIPKETPWVTDEEKCISCGACIYLCPTQTRQYRGKAYEAAARTFEAKCAPRREPEVFF